MAKRNYEKKPELTIFISWSEDRSKCVANLLRKYIPYFFHGVRILSSIDMKSGTTWFAELQNNLARSSFGIVCVTPENADSRWLHFEAGVLSKLMVNTNSPCVVPYLFKIVPSEVRQPLAQYQGVEADREGTRSLLGSINSACKNSQEPNSIDSLFEMLWDKINFDLTRIPDVQTDLPPPRAQSELVEEILNTVRGINLKIDSLDQQVKILERISRESRKPHAASAAPTGHPVSDVLANFSWGEETDSWHTKIINMSRVILLNKSISEAILANFQSKSIPKHVLSTNWSQMLSVAEKVLTPEASLKVTQAYNACNEANSRMFSVIHYIEDYLNSNFVLESECKESISEFELMQKYFDEVDPVDKFFQGHVIPCLQFALQSLKPNNFNMTYSEIYRNFDSNQQNGNDDYDRQ